ncbi:hypothetical protein elemo19C_phanotate49 [Flavobacterium phage vB_FspP_elemoA_1-9C]|jgi:hypothetical protein|uniref:Uncharacterized protein n=6 Tax=Elemovirus TaxID=2948694 RepID=A0A7D7F2H3_9CAUD|nr:hypothetical protein KNV10_gp62 [Flavobacterium phage vB_FspP_elemoA_7-9A]YP_010108954.1 hypothetical protein KNV11_gp59 [Flavobacterium phage vB_FspP_elemoF_6-3D]YP_010109042.1 hypothetical protein KNV12_gp59 [Flavobacterium phage vB_FspP_elemoE_6-9C]YP_010109110.1 hypothetical protein KNV13_gp27 [Flavobacterium phage vB_FspP_elemoD_13-5B]YP_010356127.1 hypothetical protein M1M19_gp62 [Flavobacterium phage vB_FspP_elemoB_14-3B]YP_010356487.1 hypothetical protein M1M21_gp61 [Flavobacterium 
MKLKLNDKVKIHGWVMLKGVEGELKVSKIDDVSYWFTKPRGTKVVCRHIISDVDRCITNSDNINKIEILNN